MATYDEDLYDAFLYGEGLLSYYPPALDPEDARAVVADLYPSRVNWIGNPAFADITDDDPVLSWMTVSVSRYDDGALQYDSWEMYDKQDEDEAATARTPVLDAPFASHVMEVLPGTALRFSDFSDMQYAIPVMAPAGEDKPYEQYRENLWKFAFMCRNDEEETPDKTAPAGAIGGMLVRRTDGSTDLVHTTVTPQPLPWDYEEDRESVDIVNPISSTGWYCVYEVLDLGQDAVWALPVLINGSTEGATIWFTAAIAERWDDVTLLQGPFIFMDVGQEQATGDSRATYPEPWNYDWTLADLLSLDPVIYFDGDSSLSTHTDFVWLPIGTDGHRVSGYYPQRVQRVEGLRNLMREWLPVSRTASVRYALDTPRILRPA